MLYRLKDVAAGVVLAACVVALAALHVWCMWPVKGG